jgi:hypothetical protein
MKEVFAYERNQSLFYSFAFFSEKNTQQIHRLEPGAGRSGRWLSGSGTGWQKTVTKNSRLKIRLLQTNVVRLYNLTMLVCA